MVEEEEALMTLGLLVVQGEEEDLACLVEEEVEGQIVVVEEEAPERKVVVGASCGERRFRLYIKCSFHLSSIGRHIRRLGRSNKVLS